MKKLILFLLIGALLVLPLSGCFADNKQDEGTTPNNTTENTTPEGTTPEATTPPENDQNDLVPPEPRYAISAQAPTEWEITNGDIPISLSFGLKEGCSSNAESFSNIIFEFCNNEKQIYVFKKIDIAEIEKPEYIVEYVYDEERQIVGFNYAHTEEVELPLSMFSADSGYITIAMIEWEDDGTEKGASGAGGGTILYYKRNGENTLIVSDKPTPEVTTPDNPPAIVIPPEGNKNHPPVVEGEIDKDSGLIATLVECLDKYWAHIYPFPKSFEDQINEIKNGTQPLFVAFNPEDYYFACAYYNPTHENSESLYCCAAEYTWVRYKNEGDIPEYYNDMQFVVAFQMNRASTVVNILTNDASTDIEHYSIYKPIFENGVNTAPYDASVFELWFNRAYIYLDDSDSNVIYHSKSKYNHGNLSIPCDYIDDKYFIVIELAAVNAGETPNVQEILSNDYFVAILGEYYDAIIDVIDVEKHRTIDQHGRTILYGLITFEDFVSEVVK